MSQGAPEPAGCWPVDLVPLAGLRITSGDLQLRFPSQDDLVALARLAAAGVHDPAQMPFSVPWTDAEPLQRARALLAFHWGCWASWSPGDWRLELVAVRAGVVVGCQGLAARDYAVLRLPESGSWLGLAHQGQGLGRRMRQMILHLAFAGLDARAARSAAFEDNFASLAVSRKLGYHPDGDDWLMRRGQPARCVRLLLDRADWQASTRPEVELAGLPGCRELFGF